MTEVLTPLPAPVATDAHYIAEKTEKLTLKSEPLSSYWTITLEDGTVLFTIEGEFMSLTHRKILKDAQGQTMYQIKRDTWTMGSKYYAEISDGGPQVWEMEFEYHFTGTESVMKFTNTANGGKQDHLEFKNNPIGSTGYVNYQGKPVAMIHKKKWQLNTTFELTIVAGLDMSLIVGLVLAMDDKVRASNSVAGTGAAGGAAVVC